MENQKTSSAYCRRLTGTRPLYVQIRCLLFDVQGFTDVKFEVEFETFSHDCEIIQPDLTLVFVVCVNQKVRVLVLFVVLYDTLEESALRLSDVVRMECWIWTFCMVYKVVSVILFCLIFDGKLGAELSGGVSAELTKSLLSSMLLN